MDILLDDFEFSRIIELVKTTSGIIPRDSHLVGIRNFLEKRLSDLGVSAAAYYNRLLSNADEKERLINSSTVNETYFFREELQYSLLKSQIFPELRFFGVNPIRIWSAASSSGEEMYSLYLLAASMGLDVECIASDINSDVLQKCRNGVYSKRSVRAGDGASFVNLLSPYKKADGSVEFPEEVRSKIITKKINLAKLEDFPRNQNIVFIRNVFIYFDMETKGKILSEIAENCLAEGGWLFVSMNEVASLDFSILPKCLEKVSAGKVFYFRKKQADA